MTWWKIQAVLAALAVVAMAVGAGVAAVAGVELLEITRDPATAETRLWYTGMISVVGVMAWTGTGAACLVVALAPVRERPALRLLGAFTLVLAADDAFLLHEDVLPTVLGVPELVTLATYALVALGLLVLLHRTAPKDVQLSFVVAGAVLAASLVVDHAHLPLTTTTIVVEDGLELMGSFLLFAVPALVAARLAPGAASRGTARRGRAGSTAQDGRGHPASPATPAEGHRRRAA